MCKYHNRLFIFTLLINIIFMSCYVKGRPPDRKKTFGFYDDNNDDYDLHFDQRQNGTENIRISLDGGIIATPYEEPELEPVRLLLEEWGREMMAVLYANKHNFESRNTYKVYSENEKYDTMTKNHNSKDDTIINIKNPNENELKDKNKQSIKIVEILDSDTDSGSGTDLKSDKRSDKSEQQNKIIKLKDDENETDLLDRNLNQNPEVNNIEFNNFKLPSELISQKNYRSDKRNRSKYRFLNLLRLFRPNSNYE